MFRVIALLLAVVFISACSTTYTGSRTAYSDVEQAYKAPGAQLHGRRL